MLLLDQFADIARGIGCPLCAPRPESNDEWDWIATLSASSLYLHKDQTYRGRSVLMFDSRHAARLDQLSPEEWHALSADLYAAQRAIGSVATPDHINVESLGNVVPHLHWHIIPRYHDDPRWGEPIWTSTPPEPTLLGQSDRDDMLNALRNALKT